jgi:hypothetical protein
VGKDLFGAWLVEMSYGRIGAMGRAKVRSFATMEDALAQVNACLRKRATAPRRIGVAYHVRSVTKSLPPDLPTGASPNPLGPFVLPLSRCSVRMARAMKRDETP